MMINLQKHRRKQTLAEEQIQKNTNIFYAKLHAQCPIYSRECDGQSPQKASTMAKNIFICTHTTLTLAENHQHYHEISLQHQ